MLKHVRNNGTSHWRTLFYLIGITLYVYHENIPEKKVFHCFHTDHAHFFVWNGKFWSLKNGEIAVWIYRVFFFILNTVPRYWYVNVRHVLRQIEGISFLF